MSRYVFFLVPILLFIAQSSFAKPAMVRVRCHEEDAGAKVFVNGKPKGECPRFELLLKPGKYTFTVKKELTDDSYYFWKKELDIYTDTFPLIAPELQRYYTEKYYFRRCTKTSISGCEEYVKEYPQGKYAKKVRSDLEKFYFDQCSADKAEDCRHYLKRFPSGEYAKKADKAIEDASMAQCRETNRDGCEEYLKQYPQGKYVKKIQSDLENFYFSQCSADKPRNCRHYLKKFPNGQYVQKANSIIEYSYWQSCKNKDEKSYRSYLYKHPRGQYVKQAQKILAGFPNAEKHYTDSTTGMDFVYVSGGCYPMGDTFGEGDSDENPVHRVCVNGFYIGQYEVTQGEYTKIMGSNPSNFKNGDNSPVEKVSWNDARDFIKKLNDRSGKNYRLPTEAEWEYAARESGKKVRFGTGKDTIGPDEANFDARNKYKKAYSRTGQYREQTTPVGSFSPNSLGLYDMSGNVSEWCQDWYGKEYYGSRPKANLLGPTKGTNRVIRGGSWINNPEYVRVANRNRDTPGYARVNIGFRLVLSSAQ